jgi:transcriptional regulator with XRE-family HTH domain
MLTAHTRGEWTVDEGRWTGPVAALNVRELGDFIRDQRHAAQISLRQLASQAGVSNPYLSQIERGLRKPSAEILQQIAKALRISAEVLYVQAGILEEREGGENVHSAVLADEVLSARQKQVILDIYDAFRRENAVAADIAGATAAADTVAQAAAEVPPEAAPGEAAEPTAASRTTTARGGTPAAATRAGTARKAPRPAADHDETPATRRATIRRPRAAATVGEPGDSTEPPKRATTRRTAARRTPAAQTSQVAEPEGTAAAPDPDPATTSTP